MVIAGTSVAARIIGRANSKHQHKCGQSNSSHDCRAMSHQLSHHCGDGFELARSFARFLTAVEGRCAAADFVA
jgi:hypothetical protein